MSGHHEHLKVRFYPGHGEWTCVVQRLGPDGMPSGGDEVAAAGASKAMARDRALEQAQTDDVREALRDAPV